VGGIDQADHSVLDEVPDINRVGHGRGNATGKLLDERDTGDNAGVLSGDLRAHRMSSGAPIRQPRYQTAEPAVLMV
jgi:hypothetical protein